MSNRLIVREPTALEAFLSTELQGWARKKIKRRLQARCVLVNGQAVSRQDHALEAGDEIEVLALSKDKERGTLQLEVLHEDAGLIAINKPAGLLSVASAKEGRRHALRLLRDQLSKARNPVRLWPVHRLDRETSGVLLFATSREVREAVAAKWSTAEKTYLAVVQGHPSPSRGTIDQSLRMDSKGFRAHVGPHAEAKKAVTHFETQRTVGGRALLRLNIETGRQHQIRAHLAWLGHPVIGDSRYGTSDRRMGLHAFRLCIEWPFSGERLTVETPAPDGFLALLR